MRRAAFLLLLALVHGSASAADHSIALTDDRGKTLLLPHPARRIITLAPFLTELVFAAGAGDRLVGVSAYSDFPPAAKTKPQVGDAAGLDLERLLALKPDLVLMWQSGNHPADADRLAKLGIPVLVLDAQKLADVPRLLRLIGQTVGSGSAAQDAAQAFEARLAQLTLRYQSRRKVSVFLEIWHQPLMTVSGAHFLSDVVARCGGLNVFASAATLTPTIGLESLLVADPEAIISSGSNLQENWAPQQRLRAVAQGRVFAVNSDWLHRQSPRILDGMQRVCELLETVRAAGKPPALGR